MKSWITTKTALPKCLAVVLLLSVAVNAIVSVKLRKWIYSSFVWNLSPIFHIKFKDDLDISPMNRIVELGQEGMAYYMQPAILPGALPLVLSHPAAAFRMQPHVAANIYQMLPDDSPATFAMDLNFRESTYQMQPRIPAQAYQMQPHISAETYQMQPQINPDTFEDILDQLGEPTNFNRPLATSPSLFHNRPIVGTDPLYHDILLDVGRPVTFNIIPDDEEDMSTGSTPAVDTTTSTSQGPLITTEEPGMTPYDY